MHPELETVRPERGIDIVHPGARAHAHETGHLPDDLVEPDEVEQHAASKRDGLAVVACAAGTRSDWNASLEARRQRPCNVRLVAWGYDNVGGLAVELLVENGAVPEVVARPATYGGRLGDDGHVTERSHEAGNIVRS